MSLFHKATKTQKRLRLSLYGVSGSGKTYSALALAKGLGGKVAVIDTERGSASAYANLFSFDTLEMPPPYTPAAYVAAIKAAEAEGYDICIIDSLTHAWSGAGGALEMVDNAAKRNSGGNSYAAWRDVTPEHNKLIDAIIGSKCHIIATMRSKAEYVLEANANGKMAPKKKGMAPIQRDGMEYEFDVVAEMTSDNEMVIQKTRCPELAGQVIAKPNGATSATLRAWLTDGAPMPPQPISTPGGMVSAPISNGNGHKPPTVGTLTPERMSAAYAAADWLIAHPIVNSADLAPMRKHMDATGWVKPDEIKTAIQARAEFGRYIEAVIIASGKTEAAQ